MKFDTPARHQSHRPAQGRRQARPTASTARSRQPARRPTPMSGTTSCRTRPTATCWARRSPKAASPPCTWMRPRGRPASWRSSRAENAGELGKGNERRLPVRRARDPALPPSDRRRGRGDIRAGPRGGLPDPRRLRPRAWQVRPRGRRRPRSAGADAAAGRASLESAISRVPSRQRRSSSTRATRRLTRATP